MAQNAQFANLNISLFPGDTPPYASRLGLCSSPVTIGLDISVSENDIYVTIELGIFVLENIHLAHPKDRYGGNGRIHPHRLACTIVSSRLVYCNVLLGSMSGSNHDKLQLVHNCLARVVTGARRRDHIKPVLKHFPSFVYRLESASRSRRSSTKSK